MARTTVEIVRPDFKIAPDDKIVMLGSCFTDNVGARLSDAGFDVVHNPMGPLFNPASIASVVSRREMFAIDDLRREADGWHCLAFASRYMSDDADVLLARVNDEFSALRRAIDEADVLVFTFGTAFVFEEVATGRIVGNCHRIAAREFHRRRMSVAEIVRLWQPVLETLTSLSPASRIIFTVSPIRHTADTLHGNTLSKSILHLAIDELAGHNACASYFPAFEALVDDLRDYAFYAADAKHPSPEAIDYIFSIFKQTFIEQ